MLYYKVAIFYDDGFIQWRVFTVTTVIIRCRCFIIRCWFCDEYNYHKRKVFKDENIHDDDLELNCYKISSPCY